MIKIKKIKQITETEKRTDIILDNPKFQNWFRGSKVVDSNGKPLVCFHGTKTTFDKFYPLSHFGTIDASNNFVGQKPITQNNIAVQNRKDNITPVYLSIKNPLEIQDNGNESNALAIELLDQKILNFPDFTSCYDDLLGIVIKLNKETGLDIRYNTKSILDNWEWFFTLPFNKTRLTTLLQSKGYDGLYYLNNGEDKGSISWIIFYPSQVWPIFKNSED